MADRDEKPKKWMNISIEEDDFVALSHVSAVDGTHILKMAERAIQEFIINWPNYLESDENQLRMLVLKDRKKASAWTMVKSLAYTWRDTNDDQDFEILEQACKLARYPIETVLEAIDRNEHVTPIPIGSSNTVNVAKIWLSEFMKPDQQYSVNEIERVAGERGLSMHIVKAAKRQLGYQSVRVGMAWYWKRRETVESKTPWPEEER
jgi:hypothetical protein